MKYLTKLALSLTLIVSPAAFAALDKTHADYSGTVDENFIESGPAGDGLSMVNFLLCIMSNSNASAHVNETYGSMIDENICNGVVGAKKPAFAQQIMTTSRASATANYTMDSWFTTDGDGSPQYVVAKSSITSAPTDALPRGVFSMTWNMLSNTTPSATVTAKGFLNADASNNITYVEEMPNQTHGNTMYSYVHGQLNGATGGKLRVKTQVYDGAGRNTDTTYRYVFDAEDVHYATWDGSSNGTSVCLDRTVANMLKYTNNYKMFTEDGALVTFTKLEQFPFTYTSGSDTKQGYADKWEAWLQGGEAEAAKPATITRKSDSKQFSVCWDDNDDGTGTCGRAGAGGDGSSGDGIKWHLNIGGVAQPFADPIELTARTIVDNDMDEGDPISAADAFGRNGGAGYPVYRGAGSGMDIVDECLLGATWTARSGNNCDSAQKRRASYNIVDGTEFTLRGGSTKYFVKASDSYRDLAVQAGSVCTGKTPLALSNAPDALASYAIGAVALTWANKPSVANGLLSAANAMKVIHGVEQ
tara:strand:+ start:272 stop:1861 length:1590 start_codon:yes stop_codon:yes gene_type:complete